MHFFKHLYTITKHRHKVIGICFKLGIGRQGLFHDLSKYSPTEFISGIKYYQGNCSPNAKEREIFGYSKAWLHHKGRNKHHFEYWVDINSKTKLYEPVKMPLRYLKEMFADRVAASKIYKKKEYKDSDPYDYYQSRESGLKMHPDTAKTLESWLIMLKEKSEKVTFKYIKDFKEEDYGTDSSKMSNL